MKGDGGLPAELLDGFICERFHVLPSQLEQEDMARLMPMIAALNTHSALRRVMEDYLESHGRVKPSENDWKIYADAVKAARELANA